MTPPTVASSIDAKYASLLTMDPFPGSSFLLDYIAEVLDSEFQKATPSLTNVDITPPAGSLSFPVASEELMPDIIGAQCAVYWSMTVTPTGIPVNTCTAIPSSIVSVSNDADKIESVISSGLKALSGSTEPVTPHYLGFVNVIIDAVKTIMWTVNEAGTHPPAVPCVNTYTVTVS